MGFGMGKDRDNTNNTDDVANDATDNDTDVEDNDSSVDDTSNDDVSVDDDFDKDRALNTIRKQRAEEKRLKAKIKEYEDKDKSEAQKAKDDLKETRAELAKARAELKAEQIKSKASQLQAHNPDRVAQLVDLDEYDGDADAALAALKKSDPYLFKADSDSETKDPKDNADSGSAANKRRGYSKNLTLDQVKNMSPTEMEQRSAEIDKFLASL